MSITPHLTELQQAIIEQVVDKVVNSTADRVDRLVAHSEFTTAPQAAHRLLTRRGAEASALGYPIGDCPLHQDHASPLGVVFRECWLEAWRLYPVLAATAAAKKARKRKS